jgi:hypothetical protein
VSPGRKSLVEAINLLRFEYNPPKAEKKAVFLIVGGVKYKE